MNRQAKKMTALALVLTCVSGGACAAQQITVSLGAGERIFKSGKGDAVPACLSCHGEHGMGNDSMGTPRLANQGYSFIVKQLNDFAANRRTDSTLGVMNGIARGLTDQDRKNLAIYLNKVSFPIELSDLDAVKSDGKPVGVAFDGQSIAKNGIPAKGVSACASCHGYNGRGAGPMYPVIGQQRFVYLVNQLGKWRDGSRANDPLGQMRSVARGLSDQDIYNVANFLSHAPRSTEGDTMEHMNNEVAEELKITP